MKRCYGCMAGLEDKIRVCPGCGHDQNAYPLKSYYLRPGTLIQERYLIGKALGSSPFSISYLGWDNLQGIKVVVKEYFPVCYCSREVNDTVVKLDSIEDETGYLEGLEAFEKEVLKIQKNSAIYGMPEIYDFVYENSTGYMIEAYIDGESLQSWLKGKKILDLDSSVEILTRLLNILQAAHSVGILHLNITPNNIFITEDQTLCLTDFGNAKYQTAEKSGTQTLLHHGGYASGEMYRPGVQPETAADLYAVGAVWYRMLTGLVPPEAINKNEKPASPSALGISIPAPYEKMLMKALRVKSGGYKSAGEFLTELKSAESVARETTVKLQKMVWEDADDDMKTSRGEQVFAPESGAERAVNVQPAGEAALGQSNEYEYTYAPEPAASEEADTVEKKKSFLPLLGILGGVVLIGVLAALIYVFWVNKPVPEEENAIEETLIEEAEVLPTEAPVQEAEPTVTEVPEPTAEPTATQTPEPEKEAEESDEPKESEEAEKTAYDGEGLEKTFLYKDYQYTVVTLEEKDSLKDSLRLVFSTEASEGGHEILLKTEKGGEITDVMVLDMEMADQSAELFAQTEEEAQSAAHWIAFQENNAIVPVYRSPFSGYIELEILQKAEDSQADDSTGKPSEGGKLSCIVLKAADSDELKIYRSIPLMDEKIQEIVLTEEGGYTLSLYDSEMKFQGHKGTKTETVTGDGKIPVYERPSMEEGSIYDLEISNRYTILAKSDDWYMIRFEGISGMQIGYCTKEEVKQARQSAIDTETEEE